MKIRFLFAALAVLSFSTASAEPLPLSDISAYLNGLGTVQARFTQINPDGSQDAGLLSMRRPGRARFEYDPPNTALVVVGGSAVAIFDEWSGGDPDQYPLRRTPLNLILGQNIQLDGARMVVDHRASGARTLVVAQDPQHPEYGQIGLYFDADPVRLSEWIIVNELGEETRVRLDPFVEAESLSNFLFSVEYERQKRSGETGGDR